MDKLQWFKFSYADWRMGKIQRCSEITQARFINLCCLYWSKDCFLTYEDAEIEIDKEHLDILIKKKIIVNSDEIISISFLDEQFAEIEETNKNKSKSGIIGNLKRWHPSIYKRYEAKEISLDEALKLSQSVAEVSHTDSNPIATQSQSIAEKKREEEKREEKKIEQLKIDLLDEKSKELFNHWLSYRKDINKPIKVVKTKNALIKKIKEKGFEVSKIVIDNSIENGYQGLFWDKVNIKKPSQSVFSGGNTKMGITL